LLRAFRKLPPEEAVNSLEAAIRAEDLKELRIIGARK
jgi:hypothetical protein